MEMKAKAREEFEKELPELKRKNWNSLDRLNERHQSESEQELFN